MLLKKKTKFFKKIGLKITIWYSLSVLVILLIMGCFLYYRLQHRLNKDARHILADKSQGILLQFQENNCDLVKLKVDIERNFLRGKFYRVEVRLLDVNYNVLFSTSNIFDQFSSVSKNALELASEGSDIFNTIKVPNKSKPYLFLTKSVTSDSSEKYILQTYMYLRKVYKGTVYYKNNILMIIPVLIIITFLGGWFIAKKSLSPIEKITKTAQNITALNLNTRIMGNHNGDEIEQLTNTINHMLDRLENSFKKIVQFTSDVSHELRTPIAVLKTGTEVILSQNRTAEEYCDLLENNLDEYDKLNRLVEDLLELLRTDSGSNLLRFENINLKDIIIEISKVFTLIAEVKGVNLIIGELADVRVDGDERLLRRLFTNLIDNAIKYTLSGNSVSISIEDNCNNVRIHIKDEGIGLSEANKELIFERFFRVDSSRSRETGGMGLGLSICKNIVELHNGTIELISELNVGSTFKVTIPKENINVS